MKSGMDVLVHSSLSSIGYVEGGAESVIDALLEICGTDRGTVIVPTLTGTAQDGPECPPQFDQARSPCWTGIIPETFRKRPEALRSIHPTHSVAAIGNKAAYYTADHENCLTPCGEGSPYLKLAEQGGSILLLGVSLESNTTLHAVEELCRSPYHLQPAATRCVMVTNRGESIVRDFMLHQWGTVRNFNVLHDELLSNGIMMAGKIGQANSLLIDSGKLIAYATAKLALFPDALIATG